jgi:hypothetical protein
MIQLRFNSLAGTDPTTLGPAPYFRVEGPLLQQGPDHAVVARYFDYHWEIGSRFVSSYECVDPVLLHFEGPRGLVSAAYGPFQQLRFPNGSCYADGKLFAELVSEHDGGGSPQDKGRCQWLHRPQLTRWPALIINPVGRAPGGPGQSDPRRDPPRERPQE